MGSFIYNINAVGASEDLPGISLSLGRAAIAGSAGCCPLIIILGRLSEVNDHIFLATLLVATLPGLFLPTGFVSCLCLFLLLATTGGSEFTSLPRGFLELDSALSFSSRSFLSFLRFTNLANGLFLL